MGLDFSHCDAHWSYGGFHAFRCRIADEIGINLDEMEGFGGSKSWDEVNDPIVPLLNHSDCDGHLTPEECRIVYPRLIQLVSHWDDNDYDKINALELAKGMKICSEQGENLLFE